MTVCVRRWILRRVSSLVGVGEPAGPQRQLRRFPGGWAEFAGGTDLDAVPMRATVSQRCRTLAAAVAG